MRLSQIREIRRMFIATIAGRNTGYCASHYNVALWSDLSLLGGMAGEW